MSTYLEQGKGLVHSSYDRGILRDADLSIQGREMTKITTIVGSVVAFGVHIFGYDPKFFLLGTAVSTVACLVFGKNVQEQEPKAQALISQLSLKSKESKVCPRPCPPACPPPHPPRRIECY